MDLEQTFCNLDWMLLTKPLSFMVLWKGLIGVIAASDNLILVGKLPKKLNCLLEFNDVLPLCCCLLNSILDYLLILIRGTPGC